MREVPLVMPKMSMTMTEGTFLVWHRKEGDAIQAGDLVCEVASAGAQLDIVVGEHRVDRDVADQAGTVEQAEGHQLLLLGGGGGLDDAVHGGAALDDSPPIRHRDKIS
jgi:pyruvate dehydrogenase E2 component (dihydrolipoamide acetyltransferase)